MTKRLEFLQSLGILDDIRQRLGAHETEPEENIDTSKDSKIETMSPLDLIRNVCGWQLGDENWAVSFISDYESIKKFDEENKS